METATSVGGRALKPWRTSAVAPLLLVLAMTTGARANPLETLRDDLPEEVQAALERMDGPDRQLLAIRSYMRSARSIDGRWSWTEVQIEQYLASDASRMALEAVDRVIEAFERQNPGHSLHVNRSVRSLDEQIEKWNRNPSVAAGAVELGAALELWLRDHPKADETQLRDFLAGWKPTRPVALAAPGLSPHGRARAFDFQITKDGEIIAAANTGIIDEVWGADDWGEKLEAAVRASGAPFEGPLTKPVEPWHYEYLGHDAVD